MQSSLSQRVQRYMQEHLHERQWRRVVTVLACIVVFCTTYALVLPALTLTGGTFCGKEEHCHSDECYEKVLICDLEEWDAATGTSAHTDECYEAQQILPCGREESAGHTHNEDCYGEGGALVCEQEESEGHTHTEACYQETTVLVCTEPTDTVTEGHVHTDACYEKTLICQKEEHAHSLQCYSDPGAVETPEEWEQGLPAGTGDAAKDLAAVARSQLGYAESTVNYLVGADGGTVHGYTRYGAWRGQPYAADWSALFASFCLHYANVPETAFPRGDSCESWMTELQAMERYQPSDSYSPKPGDVAFLDLDADGAADHAGIVLGEDAAAVGDVDGAVAETPLDTALGYGVLPTSAPKKAPAARSGGDVRPEITVKTAHSSNGGMTCYTGQTATTTLSISNPLSAQIDADDGTVIRLYMQFDKTNPGTGHPESADGTPSQKEGTYTVKASGSEHEYQYTVTRINGADADHYTYCLEIQRPLQGDTISLNLPSAYPSPTSAGGTNTVWGVVLTQGEKEELDKTGTNGKPGIPPKPEDGTNTQTITWTTKPNTFNLNKKCNDWEGRIVSDGKGGYTIQDLKYYIHAARNAAQTLEGVGKDHVTSVTCVDTFTLPEGVRFAPSFIEAVKYQTYDKRYDSSNGKMKVSDGTGTGIVIGGFPLGSEPYKTALSLSEDNRTLSITWTAPNNDSRGDPITDREITRLDRNIFFDKGILLIDQLKSTEPYTFTNNVKYTFHYSWSGDQAVGAGCVAERTAGKAKLKMNKSILSPKTGYFGEGIRYQIKLKNEGTLPYEKLCYVKDSLREHMYLSAGDLAALFSDGEYGKDASVSIVNATFCPANPSHTVTCADGTTSAATAARNTSADSDTKYSGCSTSEQHPEDHTGSIDIRWNEGRTRLVLTVKKADGSSEETQTCDATANGIQSVLDQLGYVVTGYTRSTIVWDLRDDAGQPVPIYGGAEIAIEFSASLMDTFMRLERDVPGFYPSEKSAIGNNYARAYGPDGQELTNCYAPSWNLSREFYLSKSATLANGGAMTEKNVPRDGETVDYRLSVQHLGSAQYDILPLTDRMSGAQVLLAEQEKNSGASWAKDCKTYRAKDGTAYYKLSHGGVYSGVWLGNQYADSVTVTESASGRDTLIKWYFANYGGNQTGNVSYKALVCPMELNIQNLSYSLDNESWLGDHETHRLYASLLGVKGTLLEFDKKIVPESDISAGNDAKVAGEDYCPIAEGQTVYYRFRLKAIAPEAGEKAHTVTITGSQLRDSLPLELRGILDPGHTGGADDQAPLSPGLNFQWKKGNGNAAGAQPGDVWIVGYQNQTQLQNEDSWSILDTGTENQQEIQWDDTFSVSLTSEAPLYIYVRLTFPRGEAWQEYAAKYSFTELVNTFYVDGVPSSVRHDLKIAARAILQKGVASVQSYNRGDYHPFADPARPPAADSLFYYENDSAALQTVLYYAVLYNGGSTRLYIGDMQDILPEGFTFGRMVYGSDYGSDYKFGPDYRYPPEGKTSGTFYGVLSDNPSYLCAEENGFSPRVRWRSGRVKAQVFRSRITFQIDRGEETGASVRYDAERGKYYLNPGEGISFGYLCRTNEYAQTPDVAVNSIAMPYFDCTGGGVEISEGSSFTTRLGPAAWLGNDGSCEIIDNAQAVASGRSGVSNDTQWLYSQVQQQRGAIKPGITKKLTAAVSQEGAVTNDPIAAHPSDTLRWAVTAVNDGESPIVDYVLTDTMQAPYRFDGDVVYTVSRSDGIDVSLGIKELFSISTASDGLSARVKASEAKTVKVNGDPVNIRIIGDRQIAVRLTQDAETGNYTLSIRFPDAYWGIPAGGTGVLTLETKRADNTLENKVFVNTCFLTPMAQSWDNTTNRGNVTVLDGVFGENNMSSVRNSAPVTTAYGFVTSSRKSVAEKGKPGNTAACDATPNYIVLPGTDSRFTYTLTVDAPEDRAMDKLIFIDGLPEPNDHSAFQNDDPRYSEFKVAFADDPNVTVTVTKQDRSVSTLTAGQFKVEYSAKTEFDADDWKGSSRWDDSSTGARSLRVTILDSSGALIPAKSHVSVRFDAKIAGEAQSGQTAWNSFGYHYSVVEDSNELEAAPLKCGVMLPIIPEIVKQVVDRSGNPACVKSSKTFRFLVYTGESLKETNEAALAEALTKGERKAALIELNVAAGESESGRRKLDDLKVCTYAGGQWTETSEDWVWESRARYTLVELPDDDPSCKFSSINHITAADGYTFIYQNDRTLVLSAVNLLDLWSFTIQKTNAYDGSALTGAWFALYSPDARDSISKAVYDALSEKPTQKPEFTLTIGEGAAGKTWYLTRVGQTRNMAGNEGTLTWDGLLREEYRYREIQAPMGYRLDDTIRTVRKSDAVHAIAIPNTGSGVRLPETGGMGTFCFTAGGVLLLTAGLLGYGWKRKRERG